MAFNGVAAAVRPTLDDVVTAIVVYAKKNLIRCQRFILQPYRCLNHADQRSASFSDSGVEVTSTTLSKQRPAKAHPGAAASHSSELRPNSSMRNLARWTVSATRIFNVVLLSPQVRPRAPRRQQVRRRGCSRGRCWPGSRCRSSPRRCGWTWLSLEECEALRPGWSSGALRLILREVRAHGRRRVQLKLEERVVVEVGQRSIGGALGKQAVHWVCAGGDGRSDKLAFRRGRSP